jgi:F-type H+-transporting ATPase subunit delta
VKAGRYARALLELSEKDGVSAVISREMAAVDVLMKKKQYFDFFTDRLVHAGEKLEVFSSFSPLTKDFLRLVIANKREEYIRIIAREYAGLLKDRNNIMDCVVLSRTPLSSEQKMKLKEKFEKRLDKTVNFIFKTDKKIIGGVRISYGTKVIDATVSGMLREISERLTGE